MKYNILKYDMHVPPIKAAIQYGMLMRSYGVINLNNLVCESV